MTRAITGLDHSILGVRDLEAARVQYERLGFTPTPRGRHIGWGTANYCVMFRHGYIELLGIVDTAQFTNNLDKFLASREGLIGFAFASDDSALAARTLASRGLAFDGPKDLGRALELPEGDVTPRFKLLMLPSETTPGVSAFICQHLTPELIRQPAWLNHANGATDLIGLTVVVNDPPRLADAYERLCGAGSATLTDETLAVRVGGSFLLFCTPDDLGTLHPDATPPAASAPYLAAMTIGVRNLDTTRAMLETRGFRPARDPAGSVRIGADQAHGSILEFRQIAR